MINGDLTRRASPYLAMARYRSDVGAGTPGSVHRN